MDWLTSLNARLSRWAMYIAVAGLLGRGGYPATKEVRGSNFCDLGWHIDARTGRVIVLSAIDNLVKGAAGQAIQNFNIACGFDEKMGLQSVPVYP